MIFKFEYKNITDRAAILKEHSDKFLIKEQNLIEGNYLIFSDEQPIDNQVKQLQKVNDELMQMNLIALEGVAILNEEVQQIKNKNEASAD